MAPVAPLPSSDAPAAQRRLLASLFSGPRLERTVSLELPEAPSAVHRRLVDATELETEPFTLVAKLSGGGIVVRVLRTPETERPFFGRVKQDNIFVAPAHQGGDVTPFQPLRRGTWAAASTGTVLTATLRPHPHAQSYDIAFHVVGVLLLVGAAIQATVSLPYAAMLGAFGLLAALFPRLRGQAGFALETRRAEAALRGVLGLPAEP